MIIVDHETGSVVLVIRGTFSPKDVIMDGVCEEAEFLDGYAHAGFLSGAKKVMQKCSSILEQSLRDNFGYNLVICGHSMGGSVAVLITMQLLRNDECSILPPGVRVRCVALAPAPVYRTHGSIPALYLDNIHIYVNDKDCVPTLSLGSVAKLLAVLREIDNVGLSLDQQLAIIMCRQDYDTVAARSRVSRAVNSVDQTSFQYLHHPGTMMRCVTRGQSVKIVSLTQEQAQAMAENLLIFESMVSDHIHTTYRENFLKIEP